MFEREIKFIYDFTTNKIKKNGQYLTFEQLKECGIHPAILQYVSAEIDYLVFEDRQRMLKESVFDYSGEMIDHYFSKIAQEIKKEKRFSLEYINKLILHAASFTVNYLVKPKWSLTKFIFDNKEHKTTTELKQIVNYVYYYGYLKKILVSYIDKKELLSINAEEFEELFGKIDKLGLETYKEDVIDTALDSMADFFNIGSVTKSKVPLNAVKIYLEERELEGHSVKLSAAFTDESILKYDISEIKRALETDMEQEPEETAEPTFEGDEIEEYQDTPEPSGETVTEEIEEVELEAEPEQDEVTKEDIAIEEEPVEDYREEAEVVFGADELEPEEENVEMDESAEIETDEETEEELVEEPISDFEEETVEIEPHETPPIEEEEELESEKIEEEPEEIPQMTEEDSEETPITEAELEELEEALELPEEEEQVTFEEDFEEMEEEPEESEIMWGEPPSEELEEEPAAETNAEEENPFAKYLEEQFDDEEEPTLFGKDEEEKEDHEEPVSWNNLIPEEEQTEKLNEDMADSETEEPGLENEVADIPPPSPEQKRQGKELLDISELLDNKDVSKIIAVVFDYDMEDFANTIDKISGSATKEEAMYTVNRLLEANRVSPKSKEAQAFISIVDEYFENR